MKQPPYSYAEAKSICEEYQYLAGHIFERGSNDVIDQVVMAPFDHFKKNRFIMIYMMLNDAKAALEMDYTGLQYDVIVISGSINDKGLRHLDLHSWVGANEQNAEIAHSVQTGNAQSVSLG
jgi:hypothetical protein